MHWLRRPLGLVLSLGLALLLVGQAGFLQGEAPPDLGVRDSRLIPSSSTPNGTSSQADLHPPIPPPQYATSPA